MVGGGVMGRCPSVAQGCFCLLFVAALASGCEQQSVTTAYSYRAGHQPTTLGVRNEAMKYTVRDDPAVKLGQKSELKSLPTRQAQTPPSSEEGSFELDRHASWLPQARFDLANKGSRQFTIRIDEPSLLLARVNWVGRPSGVHLAIVYNGTEVTAGGELAVLPDRGEVFINARMPLAGNVTVTVTNVSGAGAAFQLAIGTLPLALPVNS